MQLLHQKDPKNKGTAIDLTLSDSEDTEDMQLFNIADSVSSYDSHPTKASGYDPITGKVLQGLSQKGLRVITQLYNAILRIEYFPCQWKVGQIIMIAKPGKPPHDIRSLRTYSCRGEEPAAAAAIAAVLGTEATAD